MFFYGFTSAKMLSIGSNCEKNPSNINTIDKIEKIPTLAICQYWFRGRQVSLESFFSWRFLLFCSYFFHFFIYYVKWCKLVWPQTFWAKLFILKYCYSNVILMCAILRLIYKWSASMFVINSILTFCFNLDCKK